MFLGPNPFAHSTRIQLALADRATRDLAVYNIAGQRVRVLLSAPFGPGRREVSWDGADQRGNPLPSGMYFARLGGQRDITRNLTLIQ